MAKGVGRKALGAGGTARGRHWALTGGRHNCNSLSRGMGRRPESREQHGPGFESHEPLEGDGLTVLEASGWWQWRPALFVPFWGDLGPDLCWG